MFTSTLSPDLRRRRLVGLAVGLALTGCLIGTYLALSTGDSGANDSYATATSPQPGSAVPSGDSTANGGLRRLRGISDPEAFARRGRPGALRLGHHGTDAAQ